MKQKKQFIRIVAALAVYVLVRLLSVEGIFELMIYLFAYILAGGDVLWKAIRNIFRGQVFDENFLMSVATIGAFCVGDYPEGVAVMLFYQVGELFQSYAVRQSRKSISSLMDIRPDYANVKREGGLVIVDPEEVQMGELILVKPGEKIPLDGTIIEGYSTLDTSALTGESMPREVGAGMDIISGCININGTLTIKVSKEFGESTVAKILDLVENASSRKANTENFITRFAKYYTPAVVLTAVLLAILPPLLIPGALFSDWVYRALSFLVVSCPCALVISIPLGFFGGIGGASKQGILVKGSNYLEMLADTEIVVFDKTGTLTKGNFVVTDIVMAKDTTMTKDQLLEITAKAESYSNHPISNSIRSAYGRQIPEAVAKDIEEIAGCGVKAVIEGKTVFAGNSKLMEDQNIAYQPSTLIGTVIYVAVDHVYMGCLTIADEIKSDAAEAIKKLKAAGIKKTVMLTGDSDRVGKSVANKLGLDAVYTELLPADKVDKIEELFKGKPTKGKLVFVGDGINDAPVLARADIGIAMGGLGSDAAIEAADVVIMTDEPSKIATAIKISKKTLRIVKQNIVFALAIKAIVLLLVAFGLSNMWEAVFADVGVSLLAILNSIRALKDK